MNYEKIAEFYHEAILSNKLNNPLLSEAKNVTDESELKNFIHQKLLPIAKSMGYDFSADELITYEKNISQLLSEEDLENITGGANLKTWIIGGALSLSAILGTGFALNTANATIPDTAFTQTTQDAIPDETANDGDSSQDKDTDDTKPKDETKSDEGVSQKGVADSTTTNKSSKTDTKTTGSVNTESPVEKEDSIVEKTANVGLKILECLPTDEEGLKQFLEIPDKSTLSEENIETYSQIQNTVATIIADAKIDKTDPHKQMKKVQAIYSWVANNISYDMMPCSDAFFTFKNKKNVCKGYSRLINMMTRLAGIPSLHISTLREKDSPGHAYNAIYIDDGDTRTGWTLIDSTQATSFKKSYNRHLFDFKKKNLTVSIKENLEGSFKWLLFVANSNENFPIVLSYNSEIENILSDIIEKNKDMTESDIGRINMELSVKLTAVNESPQYKNINKIETIKIDSRPTEAFSEDSVDSFFSSLKLIISVQDASHELLESFNQILLKEYFPACYNPDISFQYANKKMLLIKGHSLSQIFTWKKSDDNWSEIFPLKVENGENCSLTNSEEDAKILINAENVTITKDILDFGLPIKIGEDVKTLTLQDDKESDLNLDLSEAQNLVSINTDDSAKYVFENGILYERKTNGEKGNIIKVIHTEGTIENISYILQLSEDGKKINNILIYSANILVDLINPYIAIDSLPSEITQHHVPIQIGPGIKSLTLHDDEVIDVRAATSLESIDIKGSAKYVVDYEHNELNENVNGCLIPVLLPANVKVIAKDGTIVIQ